MISLAVRSVQVFVYIFFLHSSLIGQVDTVAIVQPPEDLLENFAENQDEDVGFDYDDILDNLEALRRRPLNLNKATEVELSSLLFLSDAQKLALIEYRRQLGDLISIYELQAIPVFDMATIRQMLPYVSVNSSGPLVPPLRMWKSEGKSQLFMRFSRVLEESRGYAIPPEDTTRSRYLGDRNRYYMKYRFTLNQRMSFGFTAEKDPGEEFFKGYNKYGFDYYSAHFFLSNPESVFKAIAIGDYSISLGQGLLLYQGFSSGKSSFTTSIKKRGTVLRPYASVNELDFFRGAAATIAPAKNLDITLFGSSVSRDGNITENPDPEDEQTGFISSLQTSGFHRTRNEIADKGSVTQTSTGFSARYKPRRGHIAVNGLLEHLDKSISRTSDVYNRFYFNGNRLFNISSDYSFTLRNYHFFGETAMSDNGALATLNGLLVIIDQRIETALLHRSLARDYQALNAKPFAETSSARNENGLYFGLGLNPAPSWRLNAYYDIWKHEWPRFGVDAPSAGREWLVRLTYTQRRKMELYFQAKSETKQENTNDDSQKVDFLSSRENLWLRLHFSYKINPEVEWRSRLDAGYTLFEGNREKGVSAYQDIIYRSMNSPLSVSARFAIFDTDSYAIRFYAYENDLLYNFSIPAYYGKGTRFYLNTRYRVSRSLTAEARYARTYYSNQKTVGSGLDQINGPVKSEIKFQLRFEF